jgi:hypothetical protein
MQQTQNVSRMARDLNVVAGLLITLSDVEVIYEDPTRIVAEIGFG